METESAISSSIAATGKRSYTTVGFSPLRVLSDGLRQVRVIRALKKDTGPTCRITLDRLREFDRSATRLCGIRLHGLKTLEIGHGQIQIDIAFVSALGNDCTGIDMDVTPRGLADVGGYWRLLRSNGSLRTLKTLVRELTGVNRALRKEFCRQMQLSKWPHYQLHKMDACQTSFADGAFDFVYSTDVFEHIDEPEKGLREILRILKPGGAFWLRFLHYEHPNALHDLRAITGSANAPPLWAHLIPALRDRVSQGASVNHLTIPQWRQLFNRVCPGCQIELEPLTDQKFVDQLQQMRRKYHELDSFPDEELLTNHMIVAGRKVL